MKFLACNTALDDVHTSPATINMDLDPPIPKYLTSDPTSFAHTSARTRWPSIITSAIDDVHRTISTLPSSTSTDQETIAEGKRIVSQLSTLKYELQHNRALTAIIDDGEPDHKVYNEELEARAGVQEQQGEGGEVKWHDVEWLFSECYLYRRISSLFRVSTSKFWREYDCFSRQKMSTFRSSRSAVVELAGRYREVITKLREDGNVMKKEDVDGLTTTSSREEAERKEEEAEKVLFTEMAEICLWGNATDLSLLTQLTYEDIQKLQGSNARKESEEKVLVNDLPKAFEVLNQRKKEGRQSTRVDIVLDNAGFELFVDLVLAGYMIETGLATEIVLHPKSIPWFVSDVVPNDLVELLEVLRDPKGFYEDEKEAESEGREVVKLVEKDADDLKFLFEHWGGLHEEGSLILRPNRFWTAPGSFWRMPSIESELVEDLKESELVIFKGDLNYRKLTGDVSCATRIQGPLLIISGFMGSYNTVLRSYRTTGQIFGHQEPRTENFQGRRDSWSAAGKGRRDKSNGRWRRRFRSEKVGMEWEVGCCTIL